jgi:hypothetical protein
VGVFTLSVESIKSHLIDGEPVYNFVKEIEILYISWEALQEGICLVTPASDMRE